MRERSGQRATFATLRNRSIKLRCTQCGKCFRAVIADEGRPSPRPDRCQSMVKGQCGQCKSMRWRRSYSFIYSSVSAIRVVRKPVVFGRMTNGTLRWTYVDDRETNKRLSNSLIERIKQSRIASIHIHNRFLRTEQWRRQSQHKKKGN